jgi:hypothetical protein
MASDDRFGLRRTVATLDPDTPAVSLGDKRLYRRETLVLVTDEERDLVAELVGHERIARERGDAVKERRLFTDSLWVRAGIVAGSVAAIADLILAIKAAVT